MSNNYVVRHSPGDDTNRIQAAVDKAEAQPNVPLYSKGNPSPFPVVVGPADGREIRTELRLLYWRGTNDKNQEREDQSVAEAEVKILAWHQRKLEATEKAYGGCKLCYGKSFSTTLDYTSGMDTDQDIGSPGGRVHYQNPVMRYCSCDRGKQLKSLVEAERSRAWQEGWDDRAKQSPSRVELEAEVAKAEWPKTVYTADEVKANKAIGLFTHSGLVFQILKIGESARVVGRLAQLKGDNHEG